MGFSLAKGTKPLYSAFFFEGRITDYPAIIHEQAELKPARARPKIQLAKDG